tara:strand:- start:47 stop:1195 length:1149 start_codon:yes stop_codon:yes gene_type:complete
MQIYYWCPYLTNIATIKSVIRSAKSLRKYIKLNLSAKNEITILNTSGEWSFLKKNSFNIEVKDVLPFVFFKYLPKEGFIQSRLSFLIIFFTNFFPLLLLIRNKKPTYLVVHLLTILPILLSPLLSQHTRIILRISGLPNLNFFRKFIWKLFSKYIYAVTAPTKLTYNVILDSKIFDKNKVKLLRDPVIDCSEIQIMKNYPIDYNFDNNKFYLSIGRLTGQKNFTFLIKTFSKFIKDFKVKKLLIIGEGENENTLKKIIVKYKMENNIFLLGFKENVYNYINKCEALISVAEYEDPGFALIETAYLKKKLISSLVKNGPIEMKNSGDMGYFFEYNNELELLSAIKDSEKNNKNMLLEALKYAKKFSVFSHCKNFEKILKETIN